MTTTRPATNSEDLSKLTLDEFERRVGASADGLGTGEVRQRLEKYGYNEIPEKKANPFLKFLSYFWGPIPVMIMIAAALSGILQHWPDLGVIMALLVLNAVVGFREEYQAGNVINALKKKLAVQAKVKRDGLWTTVPAHELVPGDLTRLRIGDIVPADARLLDGDPVEIDQSALTGESLPVERKTGETVYSGSIVRRGEIDAIVYATGLRTYYGKTAELVTRAQTRSHLQQAIVKIANYLIFIAVGLAVVIFTVALLRHDNLLVVLRFALVLTIAAVPAALPAVLSVTMALGARVLALKQAIVTRLSAIEEVAGIDVLCADKTGTLTQNKLTMGEPYLVDNAGADEVILSAALASRAEDQDSIDLAVIAGIKDQDALKGYRITHFQPFDPVSKRTEAHVVGPDGRVFAVTKGAPQVILALDADPARIQAGYDKAVNSFASRGFRSLGVARAGDDGQWRCLGVIPLHDPLREDSRATVDAARNMGLDVKMVTGDQLAIAREIASELDLGGNILDATIFVETEHHDGGNVHTAIEQANGFAQVFPEHKYHIIEVLQEKGHIVGMTGDGVNDAPALKKADAGIAVAGSTDAARAAGDIVLLAPGLSAIIDAVKESRTIFQRMTNYAVYRIAETVRILLFLTLSVLVFNFFPITAIMIVLLTILNDGAILSIAYDNTAYRNRPEAWNMRSVLGVATVLGVIGVISSFTLFFLAQNVFHLDQSTVQSLIYLKLSVAGHLTVFVARTRGPFWSVKPARILVLAVIGTQIVATFIAVYGFLMTPLGWQWAGFAWGYALLWFPINDRVKLLAYRLFEREHTGYAVRRSQ